MELTDGRASELRAKRFYHTSPLQLVPTVLFRYSQSCGSRQTEFRISNNGKFVLLTLISCHCLEIKVLI